jgi:1-acyl-sn-glycerol-3-phosphate acyltransferase
MQISRPRAFLRLAAYLLVTLLIAPVQVLLLIFDLRLAERLPLHYHRICCRLLGFEIEIRGVPSRERPTLFVSNHISYLDIPVISTILPLSFVAKREVAGWPFFGQLSRLQRTVYVGRERTGVQRERDVLAHHLERGRNLVLFAEATSSDGSRVRPFKSALLAVAETASGGRPLVIQPMTIAYTRLDGMPIGRNLRPFFAWYGDMELVEHLLVMLGVGRLQIVVQFHEPLTYARFGSRKALTQHCQDVVGRALAELNAGRAPREAPDPGST